MAYELPLIWKDPAWPHLRFDIDRVEPALVAARRSQGLIAGKLAAIAREHRTTLEAEGWRQDAIATAAIEGERYDPISVGSSVARRLGLLEGHGPHVPRGIEGLLDVMEDAVNRSSEPLTHERLWAWQAAMFPDGRSGLRTVAVGAYRSHAEPMQIVSGPQGREKVHYEAPPSIEVPADMELFIRWFNGSLGRDPLMVAALSHVWFESIHPFEDGNGRVGRALIDLVLAREMGRASRVIRMSQQLLKVREAYYEQLQEARSVDVTAWIVWFLAQVQASCEDAGRIVDQTLQKTRFWSDHRDVDLSSRQRKVVNLLLDAGPGGFEGGMSTRKYGSIGATSRATASRELLDLERAGLLRRVGDGRSTRYYIGLDGWGPGSTDDPETLGD